MIQVGKEKIQGCVACHGCIKNQNEAWAIKPDLTFFALGYYSGSFIKNTLLPFDAEMQLYTAYYGSTRISVISNS